MIAIPTSIFTILIFLFGLCIGSFINVLVWRLPQDRKINGRSECPKCHHQLPWYDLIPLFSFVVQRGRCRYCNEPISPRYPLIEFTTGIIFAYAAAMWFPQDAASIILLVKALFVVTLCIAIFVIDLEHYLILDILVFPGIAGVLVLNGLYDLLSSQQIFSLGSTSASGLFGVLVGVIPFWLIWALSKGKWMGFGDVKYVIFMGLTLGLSGMAVGLFLAFMLGAVVGTILMVTGKKQFSSRIPFGTFLTLATLLSLFWGQPLWQAYSSLIGL